MLFVFPDDNSSPGNTGSDPSAEQLDDLLGELLGETRQPPARDDGMGGLYSESEQGFSDVAFGPFGGGPAVPQDDLYAQDPAFAEQFSMDGPMSPGMEPVMDRAAPPMEPGPAAPSAAVQAGSGPAEPGFKVELDIEDAPFLEDEREERKAPPPPPVPPVMSDIARKKGADDAAGSFIRRLLKDKRRLAIAGAVAVCVLLAPLAFLFGSGDEGQPPVQAVAEAPRPAQAIPDLPQEPAQPPVHLFQSAPYFIPTRGSEGQIRFLRCAYTLSTQNRLLYGELVQKRLILRDAVYHYLSNKPLSFLSDQQQLEGLKQDLLSVMNEHVTADKLHELYFEEYVIVGK